MAERSISVTMESTYRSDLAKGLRRDKQKLDEFQKYLDKRGLRIPIRIDLKGLQSQAGAMRKIVLGAFANLPAGIVGPNGQPVSSAAMPKRTAGMLAETTSTSYDKNGNPTARHLAQLEQLGAGVQRLSRYKLDMVTGTPSLLGETVKDVRTVRDLEDGLRGVNKQLGQAYAQASGKGDKAGQRQALTEQKRRVDALLQTAATNGLTGSPAFTRGESQSDRLATRLARLDGSTESANAKASAARSRNRFDNALRLEEERVDIAQKANAQDLIRANRISDLTRREAELNRLYQERRKIFADSQQTFQAMDAWRQRKGDAAGSDKAMRRGLNMAGHVAQVDVEETRAQAALAGHQSAERKAAAAQATADRAAAFNRELQDIAANSNKRLAAINARERTERAAAKDAAGKTAASQRGHAARQAEYQNRAYQYGGVDGRARAAGNVPAADAARGKRLGAEVAAARDQARMTAATTAGGHALNFHSSALLRNAATYVRWMVPVQAVMAVTSAFNAGVAGAIKVDRQFATLRAVFRGTDEEAQKLKKDTLELAAAQGRSADEGMDAAIRWSRLGLNRVQVLQATKVSLMAANVAEMTAAEAAEKLSAIYATYRLNIGDLPVVLARLNAISNRYNVTNKDLLEGIVRVAGVAKEAGLELRDLEGMIGAVTGATGRPGQEVGNALKFVVTRLGAPETMEGLKKGFNIDLTGPNGDLKGMSQIFRELAAIYPTLNNAQKQYFLKLTAGSRQAARFALVMDQYRQSQILAAEAGFDTSSAFRENEKILASLQSRIESLTASWTKLFTAIGDAGVFDVLAAAASGVGDAVNSASQFVGGAEQMAGREKGWVGKYMVAQTRRMGENFGSPMGMTKSMLADLWNGEFLGKKTAPGGAKDPATEVASMTANINALRERLGSLERAGNVFESIGAAIRGGTIDRKTMIRDFESGAHLLLNLEDGSNRYADAVSRFYKLDKAGDTEGMLKLVRELQDAFKGGGVDTKAQFEKAAGPVVDKLRDKLVDLDQQRRDLIGTKDDGTDAGRRKKADEVEKIQGAYKEVQGAIEQVTQAEEKFLKAAYGQQRVGAINRYMDDVLAQAAKFGEVFKDLAPDAENDPVDRIFARRGNAETLGRKMLQQTQQTTNAQAAHGKSIAEANIALLEANPTKPEAAHRQEIEFWRQLINEMDEANLMIQTRIGLEDTRLEQALRQLDIERQAETLKRVQTDASKGAAMSSLAWRFGETDSDKDANQAALALRRARAGLMLAEFPGPGTETDLPSARARNAGQVLQDEATARRNLESMETRAYEIAAAKKQVEIDTLKAVREQTAEAAKRFAIASREDQLRVSALSRTLRDRPVGANEFYALSQETRQAFVNYLPNQAPGRTNEARDSRAKALGELDAENTRLSSAIGSLRAGLETLAKDITGASRQGGALDVLPNGTGQSVQNASLTRDGAPLVNVAIGNVAVNVQIAQQVERLVSGYVDRALAVNLAAMEARLTRPAAPHAQGVVE